ncbi:hypothetical protein [Maribellus sediminis]|uniref:hypothetical protein n=1 Tax=Maribellus sediminis TaxID=2696285 RepID=UPI00142F7C25|nr:hypothetical protein [Maribellus sediminis]
MLINGGRRSRARQNELCKTVWHNVASVFARAASKEGMEAVSVKCVRQALQKKHSYEIWAFYKAVVIEVAEIQVKPMESALCECKITFVESNYDGRAFSKGTDTIVVG